MVVKLKLQKRKYKTRISSARIARFIATGKMMDILKNNWKRLVKNHIWLAQVLKIALFSNFTHYTLDFNLQLTGLFYAAHRTQPRIQSSSFRFDHSNIACNFFMTFWPSDELNQSIICSYLQMQHWPREKDRDRERLLSNMVRIGFAR